MKYVTIPLDEYNKMNDKLHEYDCKEFLLSSQIGDILINLYKNYCIDIYNLLIDSKVYFENAKSISEWVVSQVENEKGDE